MPWKLRCLLSWSGEGLRSAIFAREMGMKWISSLGNPTAQKVSFRSAPTFPTSQRVNEKFGHWWRLPTSIPEQPRFLLPWNHCLPLIPCPSQYSGNLPSNGCLPDDILFGLEVCDIHEAPISVFRDHQFELSVRTSYEGKRADNWRTNNRIFQSFPCDACFFAKNCPYRPQSPSVSVQGAGNQQKAPPGSRSDGAQIGCGSRI